MGESDKGRRAVVRGLGTARTTWVLAVAAGALLAGCGSASKAPTALTFTLPLTPTSTTSSTPPRKAYDASAKELARTAETTAETIATDNHGSYASVTREKLKEYYAAILVCTASEGQTCLSAATGTKSSYTVTTRAEPSGDEFTIERKSNGEVIRKCVERERQVPYPSCGNGSW